MSYKQQEINVFLKLGTTIGIVSTLLISWLLIAKVDIVANTEGKIITESKNQTISVLETSAIQKVFVKEGEFVKKGQTVALLDNINTTANHSQIEKELSLSSIRLRGIEAQLDNKSFIKLTDEDKSYYDQISMELNAKKINYENNLLTLEAEALQNKNELISSRSNLNKLENGRAAWEHQLEAYMKLKETGAISKLDAEAKIRESHEKVEEIKITKELIAATEAKYKQSEIKIALAKTDYRQNLLKEKTELVQKIDNLKQEEIKTKHNMEVRNLTSPIDGFVKEITTNSSKAVLNEGTTLMTIVPNNEKLKAEILVKNSDIGYIEENQIVKLKVETYAFQKYGLLKGKVDKISPDSIEDKDSKQNYYHIIVALDGNYLEKDNKKYYIKPGMSVNADIVLSQRTIFEYLTSPLQKTILEAGHEK